jgi:hypothetical protein
MNPDIIAYSILGLGCFAVIGAALSFLSGATPRQSAPPLALVVSVVGGVGGRSDRLDGIWSRDVWERIVARRPSQPGRLADRDAAAWAWEHIRIRQAGLIFIDRD